MARIVITIKIGAVSILFLIIVVVCVATAETGTEKILYSRQPVTIHLKTGSERSIVFPAKKLLVSIDRRIDTDLQTTPLDGILYLKAIKDFPRTRIRVIAQDTGQTYLLDIEASDKGNTAIVEIVLPKKQLSAREETNDQPDMIAMSRYAAQQLYAPRRLVTEDVKYSEIQVIREATRRLYRGGDVIATPYKSWRAGVLYVTAVRLQNSADYAIDLDFRQIRGPMAWRSAVFQHMRLSPHGSAEDQTFLYLVSDREFNEIKYEEAIR